MMKTDDLKRLAVLGAGLVFATTGSAVLNVVYTGTVDSDATGTYAPGTEITLTFTVSAEVGAGSGQFSSDANSTVWGTESTAQASTWSSVSSSSLGGTWAEGSFDASAPRDALTINEAGLEDVFSFSTGIDTGTSVGLNLGGNEITGIQVTGLLTGFNGTFSLGSYVSPAAYLADFAGSYSATGLSGLIESAGGDLLINGGTLDIVVIPEAQYTWVYGFLGSLLLVRRRR